MIMHPQPQDLIFSRFLENMKDDCAQKFFCFSDPRFPWSPFCEEKERLEGDRFDVPFITPDSREPLSRQSRGIPEAFRSNPGAIRGNP